MSRAQDGRRAVRDPGAPAPRAPMSWHDARVAAHRSATPTPPAQLALADALGGVLAEPLRALVAVPVADCSAMDGYAVCGSPPWTVVGQLRAGDREAPPLRPGTACEIATGAPVPVATLAVLPYEQAEHDGDRVSGRIEAGRHVRRAGEECAAGEVLLTAGTVLGPAAVGLAAVLGHDTVPVRRPVRVTALITGNELLESGVPAAGQVRDAIGPMLPGLVAWAGARFDAGTRLADSAELLTAGLADADADVVLVSGSSSRGPADHLRGALARLGAELVVDGVACRPGHPQALARLGDGRLVVGLPGNPLAAFVAFLTLALPAITGLRGLALPELPPGPAVAASEGPTRLAPVQVRDGAVVTLAHRGSAMLRSLAVADAVAVVTPSGSVYLHPLPGPR